MARNKSKNTTNFKSSLTIAILLFMVCAVAYSTCTDKKVNGEGMLNGTADEELLTKVRTEGLEDTLMLHYPGFDVLFSNIHKQPYYVAWVLTPENARATAVKRSNNFRPDPNVENSAQLSDYKRSGFDRGHMAPSADFRYSADAQDATFFLTNISPQHTTLNTKAWANLEEQCRNWAKRDSTLIIITGPVLNDKITATIGESRVSVPSRFFKVVFAPYANPPRAIAFVMPNHYVEGGVQATATTVDMVEQITGYDFFSSLPDDVEAEIESHAKYPEWQYAKKRKQK